MSTTTEYIKKSGNDGLQVKLTYPDHTILFDLGIAGYELDEDDNVNYQELWNEVRNSLINSRSSGTTWIYHFNNNGTYDITFNYATNKVHISSSNFGVGLHFTITIDSAFWVRVINELLTLYP
jgi:hypothetical protein